MCKIKGMKGVHTMLLKIIRYIPLLFILLAAVGIAFMCADRDRSFAGSSFVFAQGQV